MVATVEISGNFDRQDGRNTVTGTLYFTLSKRDFDGTTVIEPVQQDVELDGEGRFAVQLWPNDRGRTGSTYLVEYLPAGGRKREVLDPALFVPEASASHDLSDLLLASSLAQNSKIARIVPITAEEFAAKQSAGTLTDALYLVEGTLA